MNLSGPNGESLSLTLQVPDSFFIEIPWKGKGVTFDLFLYAFDLKATKPLEAPPETRLQDVRGSSLPWYTVMTADAEGRLFFHPMMKERDGSIRPLVGSETISFRDGNITIAVRNTQAMYESLTDPNALPIGPPMSSNCH
ncbi:MAG: hypothetical protein V4510_03700 [bacterium]